MSATWNTAYGPRRVRRDPPTLAEAIAAAQGFIDDCDLQIDFAASLMGIAPAAVRSELCSAKAAAQPSRVAVPTRTRGLREVVVERKASRRRLDGSRVESTRGELSRIEAVRQSVLAGRR